MFNREINRLAYLFRGWMVAQGITVMDKCFKKVGNLPMWRDSKVPCSGYTGWEGIL
jgi:hypothetical protein